MDRDRELAGQVDALLGRHLGTGENTDESNVPVLTELVEAPAWISDMVSPPLPAADVASTLLQDLSEQEIDALSNDIFTRVLNRIDHGLAAKLEDRIAAQLSTQINSAINHVISDMRQDIANEIGDAVNAALADRLRQK
jgi:Na+/serine symporter